MELDNKTLAVIDLETDSSDDQDKLVHQAILLEDIHQNATISSTSLSESLDGLFDRMRHSIPCKRLERKHRLNGSDVDINIDEYLQPLQLFDPKRLMSKQPKELGSTVLTTDSKNPFVKIKPLKGFKDPLKLAKKCHTKIPNFPSQSSFVLFHEGWQYIPPPDLHPLPHVVRKSFSDSFVQLSPFPLEMMTLGKYETPKVPKYRKSKRRAKTAIGIPSAVTEIPIKDDIYYAPIGSRENYSTDSFTKFIEFTDADRALEEVSSLISLHVLRKPTKKREIVATLVTDRIPEAFEDYLTSDHEPEGDSDKLMPDETKAEELIEVQNSNVDLQDLSILDNNPQEDDKIINPSNSEAETELEIKEEEIPTTFTIDLIEMSLRRPHFVRRTVKESTSVATWINSNIIGEFHSIKNKNTVGSRRISKRQSKTENLYKPPANLQMDIHPLQQKLRAKPRTLLADFHEKYYNRPIINESKSFPLNLDQDDHAVPTAVNSIDEFLKEQEENPAVFHVFKTMCTKRFSNYGIDDLSFKLKKSYPSTSSTTSDEETKNDQNVNVGNESQPNQDRDQSEYMDNWWNQNGKYVIFAEDLKDESYFASEEGEDEDSKSFNNVPCDDKICRRVSVSDNNVWASHPWYNKVYGINTDVENEKVNDSKNPESESDRLSEEANFDDNERRSSLSSFQSLSHMRLEQPLMSTSTLNPKISSALTIAEPVVYETGSVSASSKWSRSMVFLKRKTSLKSSRTGMVWSSFPSQSQVATESENEGRKIGIRSTSSKERTKGPKILKRCMSKVSSFCSLLFGPSKSKR